MTSHSWQRAKNGSHWSLLRTCKSCNPLNYQAQTFVNAIARPTPSCSGWLSICLSVCLSRSCILCKRPVISSNFFQLLVVPPFSFFSYKISYLFIICSAVAVSCILCSVAQLSLWRPEAIHWMAPSPLPLPLLPFPSLPSQFLHFLLLPFLPSLPLEVGPLKSS